MMVLVASSLRTRRRRAGRHCYRVWSKADWSLLVPGLLPPKWAHAYAPASPLLSQRASILSVDLVPRMHLLATGAKCLENSRVALATGLSDCRLKGSVARIWSLPALARRWRSIVATRRLRTRKDGRFPWVAIRRPRNLTSAG